MIFNIVVSGQRDSSFKYFVLANSWSRVDTADTLVTPPGQNTVKLLRRVRDWAQYRTDKLIICVTTLGVALMTSC